MEIPKDEFSFTNMNELFDNGLLKDHLDCKNYIAKYFHPTTSGTHILFESGKPLIIQDETMKKVYISRFKKEVGKWYLTETIPKKLICDINEPALTETHINICPTLKHLYKKYSTFSEDIQTKVKIFLDYVKLIWASDDAEVYTYILSWFSNVVKGIKNKSCLYAKGPEGIGKSTLPDMIVQYTIGNGLCVKGKADHLKGQHNMQLLGKVLVVFEELQYFSDKEWMAIDSEIKDLITGDYASYTDKYEKRFDAHNINNYIVNSNYNAIKGANGRRYLVCDINPEKQNNFKYFENIRNNCFNNDVGHALFCFLKEIDTSKFNSLSIPDTKAKLDLCADLMTPVEKFLKSVYVLNERGINCKVKTIHQKYSDYCTAKKINEISIQKFSNAMRELNINYKKTNGYNVYKISYEDLHTIAKKRNGCMT